MVGGGVYKNLDMNKGCKKKIYAWKSFCYNFGQSQQGAVMQQDMIVVIELLTKLMEVLDFLTEKLGLFGTALTGIAIYAFVKNFD